MPQTQYTNDPNDIEDQQSFEESVFPHIALAINPLESKEFQDRDLEEKIRRVTELLDRAERERVRTPLPRHKEIPISDSMTAGEIDAKIAVAEARTDTKFAELRIDLKGISVSLAALEGIKSTVIVTGITSVLAVGLLLVAVLTFGNDRFGSGVEAGALANEAARRAVELVLPRQSLGTVDQTPTAPDKTN